MTELQALRQRRALVVLAAELQRTNVVRRLDRIQANPVRKLFGFAAGIVARPALFTLGAAAIKFAVRAFKRRSVRSRLH